MSTQPAGANVSGASRKRSKPPEIPGASGDARAEQVDAEVDEFVLVEWMRPREGLLGWFSWLTHGAPPGAGAAGVRDRLTNSAFTPLPLRIAFGLVPGMYAPFATASLVFLHSILTFSSGFYIIILVGNGLH